MNPDGTRNEHSVPKEAGQAGAKWWDSKGEPLECLLLASHLSPAVS